MANQVLDLGSSFSPLYSIYQTKIMLVLAILRPMYVRRGCIHHHDNIKASINLFSFLPFLQELAGDATLLFYGTEEGNEGKTAYLQRRRPDFSKFPRLPWHPYFCTCCFLSVCKNNSRVLLYTSKLAYDIILLVPCRVSFSSCDWSECECLYL